MKLKLLRNEVLIPWMYIGLIEMVLHGIILTASHSWGQYVSIHFWGWTGFTMFTLIKLRLSKQTS